MELTIQEQIKQCEDIIEGNGDCPPVPCSLCVLDGTVCSMKDIAKAKLKQLRGENMDIKERIKNLEERMAMTATAWNQMKNELIDIKTNLKLDDIEKRLDKLDKKEQEKEIEFVVGGVYEFEEFDGNIILHTIIKVYANKDGNGYQITSINGDNHIGGFQKTKESIINILKENKLKYTGRTLSDIINGTKD
jgi:hypothetical protein